MCVALRRDCSRPDAVPGRGWVPVLGLRRRRNTTAESHLRPRRPGRSPKWKFWGKSLLSDCFPFQGGRLLLVVACSDLTALLLLRWDLVP
jgi:hypothetical protein